MPPAPSPHLEHVIERPLLGHARAVRLCQVEDPVERLTAEVLRRQDVTQVTG